MKNLKHKQITYVLGTIQQNYKHEFEYDYLYVVNMD